MGKWIYFSLLAGLLFSPPAAAAEKAFQSTVADQTAVEVTVYNNDLGLVKDVRRIILPAGVGELRFMDVASRIMPVTVHAKSRNRPDDFTVREQNYEYDLMNADKLLDKYVGKKIKLLNWHEYQDRKDVVEATLLSNNQGQIYRINDEIWLGHPGYRILPEIPENLIAKPTLTWLYRSAGKEPHDLEVSYLTKGINWKADYVLVLDQADVSADLSGWVTLDNKSGAAYNDARLKLVAGEVNRVQEGRYDRIREMKVEAGAPQFAEQQFFEYHLYDLERKTTIKDNQTKQVSLLEAAGIGVRKEFLVYGISSRYSHRYQEKLPKQPVQVYVVFMNSADNRLGMALPAGVMRLYKKDKDESLQFIGEDKIAHTPKNEEVRLKVGEAFDLVAEAKQTDFREVTTRLYETAWEVTLRNHKKEPVTIGLIEPVFGSWKMLSNSHPFQKVDAFTIRFDVKVAPEEEVKVAYRIQVGLE